jgi:peptidoglycan/LPS O-acetylase OafA/YrhL
VIISVEKTLLRPHLQQGTWEFFFALTLITVPLVLAVSHLMYTAVEAPCMRFGKQLSRARPSIDTPLVVAEGARTTG